MNSSKDLVERLRDSGHMTQRDGLSVMLTTASQAAAHITALERRLGEALIQLEELTTVCETEYCSEATEAPYGDDAPEDGPWGFGDHESVSDGIRDGVIIPGNITFGHIRRARAFLNKDATP